MSIEKEELKTMLEEFKTSVKTAIDDKSKAATEKTDKEVTELKEKLAAAETALADIKKQLEKPFGLPGVELEKERFNWNKFFVGQFKDLQANKGQISHGEAKKFWEEKAGFEDRVCKDYASSAGETGAYLVPPQIYQGDVIDTVYANTAVMKMPVMKFTNLKSDIPIPVDNGHLTAYHVGETKAPAKSESTFGLKWLRPKKIGVYVRISNRLLYETSNAIEMIVKGKMALDAAVELSRGLTDGKGSDSEPMGIDRYYSKFSGIKNIATNGRRWTIDDIAAQKQALANANELRDTATYGTILHPSVEWGMLREKTEMYSGQTSGKGQPILGKIILDKSIIENALKTKIESTTQIPLSTTGTSATTSKVITGDWSKFAFATFRDPIFRISDQASDASGRSALLNDEVLMVMFFEYDCLCMRPSSFCGFDGAETVETKW